MALTATSMCGMRQLSGLACQRRYHVAPSAHHKAYTYCYIAQSYADVLPAWTCLRPGAVQELLATGMGVRAGVNASTTS